jgi:hypothetical protein
MKYTIIQTQTYQTTMVVEADSLIEAEDKYFELRANGIAFDAELIQNNIIEQTFEINPKQ